MRKRIKVVDIKEMNRLLSIVKKQCPFIFYRQKTKEEDFKRNAYIELSDIEFKLSFCLGLKPCTYICRLDGQLAKKYLTSGAQAYALFHRYYKEAKLTDIPENINAKQKLRKNPKFDGVRVKAYGYDMHEAFSNFLMSEWPDTTEDLGRGYIKDGYYGFCERADGDMKLIDTDLCKKLGLTPLADHRFKKIPCPQGVKEFVKHIEKNELYAKKQIKRYEELIKKHKKDKDRVAKYKEMLKKHTIEKNKCKASRNFTVGYFTYTNPWIRNMVVGQCNNFFGKLWNPETSIYSNTDSMVSTVRIPELEAMIGDGVGQIEFEHGKDKDEYFAWKKGKMTYQWNLDLPKYQGKAQVYFKKWAKEHGRPWDILRDELPPAVTPYIFNKDKLKIVRNKEW